LLACWTSPSSASCGIVCFSGDFNGLERLAGFRSWNQALTRPLELYFEVSLNSLAGYKQWLRSHVDERSPIPYVREAADRARQLEGATHVDALLLAPETHVGVLFEAKVISDCSSTVTFDVLRNQIARNVDVMLDAQPRLHAPLSSRDPDRSAFVLLTPELFRSNPSSRLSDGS
jgi:hypothetical protein